VTDGQQLLIKGVVILVMLGIAFPVHEFSHALAAYRLGDSTARYLGRLTLDPRVHFDPMGGLLMIISVLAGVGIGWAKPTPYNPYNLRGGRWGEALVSLAGPGTNLVLATLSAVALGFIGHGTGPGTLLTGLRQMAAASLSINCLLAVFNLIPIPPLDGGRVLTALLPLRAARQFARIESVGMMLVLLVLLNGNVVGRLVRPVMSILLRIAGA